MINLFVSVVIDLKAKEIDKLYDYFVPNGLKELIQIGSRVVVPFGSMERVGYVLEMPTESMKATKPILDVLDPTPILNEESMLIYQYLYENTTSLRSAIIETIIPSEFMMNYFKTATIVKPFRSDLLINFSNEGTWKLTKQDKKYYRELKRLEKDGFIKLATTLESRVKPKILKGYQYNEQHKYKRIANYSDIIDMFNDKPTILRKELLDYFSVSAVNTLLKNEVLLPVDVTVKRNISHEFEKRNYDIILNSEQEHCLQELSNGLETNREFLLFGVTGSGKTEVYTNLVDKVVKSGKRALVLVPEINMIGQVAQRLKSSFGNVAIIHSSLSGGEKHDQYEMILSGEAKIILGTRSAVFAPIENLGVIIIDEEQDESYMQTESVIYDTKNIAKIRSDYHHCPIVYVSATPKVETMYKAKHEDLTLLSITKRAVVESMPEIELINLKDELKKGQTSILSNRLIEEINKRLQLKEQIIVLVNRKGFAPIAMCRTCGHVPDCPNCNISLTYYKSSNEMKCHYCGYHEDFAQKCQKCHSDSVSPRGIAIELVIDVLKKQFKDAKILQMDKTTTTKKGSHEKLWYQFLKNDADILVGTQMVAKGFDFPDVTLVAVILADQDLKIASYNADEKTYFLLEQLIGRAGRHKPGLAIIQGYNLDHFAIKSVTKDYQYFYEEALKIRQLGGYPPFSEMSQIIGGGPGFLNTYQQMYLLKELIAKENIRVLGPTEAFIFKQGRNYRFKLTLKHKKTDLDKIIMLTRELNTKDIKITYTPFLDVE